MSQKNKIYRTYLPFLIIAIVTSAAFRTAAILMDFNIFTGYFDSKGLINTASVIVVASSVLFFTYPIFSDGKRKLIASFATPATYVPTGAVCASLLFFAFETAKDAMPFYKTLLSGGKVNIASSIPSFISALLIPLAILSAGYFITSACVFERASEARAGFGIIAVVFLSLYATFLYFDTTLTINAPNKIIDQMAFIFSALFFLYEIRISLGRDVWNLYTAFGFTAALLCAYSSIPSLVAYFTGRAAISYTIEENALTLSLFLFIISRLFLAARLDEDKVNDAVVLIREQVLAHEEEERLLAERLLEERRLAAEAKNAQVFEENPDAVQISYDLTAPDDAASVSADFDLAISDEQTAEAPLPLTNDDPLQEKIDFSGTEA